MTSLAHLFRGKLHSGFQMALFNLEPSVIDAGHPVSDKNFLHGRRTDRDPLQFQKIRQPKNNGSGGSFGVADTINSGVPTNGDIVIKNSSASGLIQGKGNFFTTEKVAVLSAMRTKPIRLPDILRLRIAQPLLISVSWILIQAMGMFISRMGQPAALPAS